MLFWNFIFKMLNMSRVIINKALAKAWKVSLYWLLYCAFNKVLHIISLPWKLPCVKTPHNKQPGPCKMGPDSLLGCNKGPKQQKSQTFSSAFQTKSSCIQTLQMWLLMHISCNHKRQDINAAIHLHPYSQCPSFSVYCHQRVH